MRPLPKPISAAANAASTSMAVAAVDSLPVACNVLVADGAFVVVVLAAGAFSQGACTTALPATTPHMVPLPAPGWVPKPPKETGGKKKEKIKLKRKRKSKLKLKIKLKKKRIKRK